MEDINQTIRLRKKPGKRDTVYATFKTVEYDFKVVLNEVEPSIEASKLDAKVVNKIILKIKQYYTNAELSEEDLSGSS